MSKSTRRNILPLLHLKDTPPILTPKPLGIRLVLPLLRDGTLTTPLSWLREVLIVWVMEDTSFVILMVVQTTKSDMRSSRYPLGATSFFVKRQGVKIRTVVCVSPNIARQSVATPENVPLSMTPVLPSLLTVALIVPLACLVSLNVPIMFTFRIHLKMVAIRLVRVVRWWGVRPSLIPLTSEQIRSVIVSLVKETSLTCYLQTTS